MTLLNKLNILLSFPLLLISNSNLNTRYTQEVYSKMDFLKNLNEETKFNFLKKLLTLKVALRTFLNENKKELTQKERVFIRALYNFVLQLKRFSNAQEAKNLFTILNSVPEIDFLKSIKELAKEKRISDQVILLEKRHFFGYTKPKPAKIKK